MAKYLGLLTSDSRGKIGGIVTTKARSSTTLRAKGIPVQPFTVAQVAGHQRVASANNYWQGLAYSYQLAWITLAQTVSFTNTLGQVYNPSGQILAMQCALNSLRIGRNPPTPPPSVYPTNAAVTNVSLTFVGTNPTLTWTWVPAAPASQLLFIYCTSVLSPGIRRLPTQRLRYMGSVGGGASTFGLGPGILAAFGQVVGSGALGIKLLPVDDVYTLPGTPYYGIL